MPKNKLEMYVGVLKILAQNYSPETSHFADLINLGTNGLKKCVGFLLKQGLVENRKLNNNKEVYLITQRGIRVLEFFKQLNQDSPKIDKASIIYR